MDIISNFVNIDTRYDSPMRDVRVPMIENGWMRSRYLILPVYTDPFPYGFTDCMYKVLLF